MRYRFVLFLSLCCNLSFVAVAQQVETVRVKTVPGPYLRFDQFTVNNETFKQASHKSMQLQDSQGYLWFLSDPNPTQQLIRYDGTYYKSFGTEGWIYQGSPGNGIVRENEYHEIWAASKHGLALFDPVKETFRAFRNPFSKEQPIGYWVMGKGGKHWFTDNNWDRKVPLYPVIEFDSRKRLFRQVIPAKLINGYTNQVEKQTVRAFFPLSVDSLGHMWCYVQIPKLRLYSYLGYYDAAKNALVYYPVKGFFDPEYGMAIGQKLDALEALTHILLKGRYVWLSSWSHVGLLRLDTQTHQWKQFYFPSSLQNRIFQIIPRNEHQFWLSTETHPLLFDITSETLYEYPHQPENAFTPNVNVGPYNMGHQKSLWLGQTSSNNQANLSVLHDGKQKLRVLDDTLRHYQNGFRVLHKQNHKLYFTYKTNYANFAVYDELSRTVATLYNPPTTGLSEQAFFSFLCDSINQTSWLTGISPVGSIFRFDEKHRSITPVLATIQGLPAPENKTTYYGEIRVLVQDKAGDVWFPSYGTGKSYGNGTLIKFDSRTKQFVGYRAGTHGLPIGQIRWAMADKEGKIWLGYRGGGPVHRFDPLTNQATTILKNTNRDGTDAMKIVDDPDRNLVWIARFGGGLWQYDREKKRAKQVLTETILSVQLTKNGVIWLKTSNSLVRFIPETNQLTRYGSEYDLHNFDELPFTKTDDDEFFFGKFRFYDKELKPATTKPNVVFSFIKVFERELHLPQSLNHTKTIELNYDQNFFSIGFSALSYFQSERNQYAYRLVDFNKDWVNVGNKPLAVFSNVPPGDYQLQIKGSNNDGLWSDVKTIAIHITPPFWQTWWFRLLVFILLIAAVVMLYRFQLERRTLKARLEAEEAKRKQKEAELSEQAAAYQLKLSQTEMAALRSQMNPHFIFNCLNSIQYFTAQNDAEKASDYLTKFSRLIRLVLENSKSEKVTLANELETLRLYIEMEIMRFQQKVQYDIQVDDQIDVESVQIPPLLLQPFIENAIWHGLMHKEDGGSVHVHVSQPKEDLLHIEITDDGVGRQKAAAFKSRSATKNKSFGMKLTAERIELINQLYQTHTQVDVLDLLDVQGRAVGTKVVVEIPI